MRKKLTALCMCIAATGAFAQCPQITINQKYDHNVSAHCVENGWDTLVNCVNGTLVLEATPFITTQHFNGTYLIESIPYNPVDPSFHAGSRLNISTDDAWENSAITFPFTFIFFGYPYTQAVVGSNGLVSFDLTKVGQHCAYNFHGSLPIPNSSFPEKNAIYGVYEDIDPGGGLSTMQGMFRYVGGNYPCRYLCASVNEVPLFSWSSHLNQRSTYQIVCYEGTNIIEVHIKQRSCCATANIGEGLVGIQNATGQNQVSHFHDINFIGDPSYYIEPNSPGAFVPPGRGNQSGSWTDTVSYEAWRFTPQGETSKNISWWRLFEDANGNVVDSVEFTGIPTDTNGYYLNSDHTLVRVTPRKTTRYMVKCVYKGANGYWYGLDGASMRDTITVGMDTLRDMWLVCDDSVLCEGERTSVSLLFPDNQELDSCTWSAVKEYNGARSVMPAGALMVGNRVVQLNSQEGQLHQNHVDSTWIFCTATFRNGCNNYDSLLVRTFPNYHFYDTAGICQGESYTWCGMTLRSACDTSKHYYSVTECDSTRHLHLVVSDRSYATDFVLDCKPHTWINGRTYDHDNDDSREGDTVVLKNEWGCDSVVSLDFTLIPMKAVIEHNPEVATLDELTIDLYDRSYGHDSHCWLFPDGRTSTASETSIIFPLNGVDTMDVRLAVHNNYGCDDTAMAVIPLHRVSEFVPNVFTPGKDGNNRFAPAIQGNVTDVYVWVYNRRGELMSHFTCPGGSWDGTDLKGRPCVQGTYTYVIRFRNSLEPMMTQVLTGTVTLLR